LSTHLRLGFPSGLFLSGFPTNILYASLPIHATCPALLILLDLIILSNYVCRGVQAYHSIGNKIFCDKIINLYVNSVVYF
jgi:hypothetical protein